MSDFSDCTSSVLQPEICNFFPLSFPLWKKVIPSKIFFFQGEKIPAFFFSFSQLFLLDGTFVLILPTVPYSCSTESVSGTWCQWVTALGSWSPQQGSAHRTVSGWMQARIQEWGWSVYSKHHHLFGQDFQKLPITQHTSAFSSPR